MGKVSSELWTKCETCYQEIPPGVWRESGWSQEQSGRNSGERGRRGSRSNWRGHPPLEGDARWSGCGLVGGVWRSSAASVLRVSES